MLGRKFIMGESRWPGEAILKSGTDRPHSRLRPLGYTLIDAEGFVWFAEFLLAGLNRQQALRQLR
jgi:hypothetical protein